MDLFSWLVVIQATLSFVLGFIFFAAGQTENVNAALAGVTGGLLTALFGAFILFPAIILICLAYYPAKLVRSL